MRGVGGASEGTLKVATQTDHGGDEGCHSGGPPPL